MAVVARAVIRALPKCMTPADGVVHFIGHHCDGQLVVAFKQSAAWQKNAKLHGLVTKPKTGGPGQDTGATGFCAGACLDWIRKSLVSKKALNTGYKERQIERMLRVWALPTNDQTWQGAQRLELDAKKAMLQAKRNAILEARTKAKSAAAQRWERVEARGLERGEMADAELEAGLAKLNRTQPDNFDELEAELRGEHQRSKQALRDAVKRLHETDALEHELNDAELEQQDTKLFLAQERIGQLWDAALARRKEEGAVAAHWPHLAARLDNVSVFKRPVTEVGFSKLEAVRGQHADKSKQYRDTRLVVFAALMAEDWTFGRAVMLTLGANEAHTFGVCAPADATAGWELFDPNLGVFSFKNPCDVACALLRLLEVLYGETLELGQTRGSYVFFGRAGAEQSGEFVGLVDAQGTKRIFTDRREAWRTKVTSDIRDLESGLNRLWDARTQHKERVGKILGCLVERFGWLGESPGTKAWYSRARDDQAVRWDLT